MKRNQLTSIEEISKDYPFRCVSIQVFFCFGLVEKKTYSKNKLN